jgi:hypothetical protein
MVGIQRPKMKTSQYIAILISWTIIFWGFCVQYNNSSRFTNPEEIASQQLNRFAYTRKIPVTEFSLEKVWSHGNHPWIFQYTRCGTPQIHVIVMIDQKGGAELSSETSFTPCGGDNQF